MIEGMRIRQARELRDKTQTALAQRVQVNQSTIASIEVNRFNPSNELVAAIAIELGFPVGFFSQDAPTEFPIGSHLLFRARASLSARKEAQTYRYAQTIYECAIHMAQRLTSLPLRLPRLPDLTPEEAAKATRSALGLSPDTPIANLTYTIEKAGVLVMALPIEVQEIDAFSLWAGHNNTQPVISVLRQEFGDRLRFSTAHEIGHLVMHQSLKGAVLEIEREAQQFAGALLLPEIAMRDELVPPITLSTLAEMKPRWRTSMQAIAMRAFDLDIISARQKTYLFQQMTARNMRRREPASLDIPLEKPRALRQMAELLYGVPINYQRLARDVRLPELLLQETLSIHAGAPDKPVEGSRILAFPGVLP